MTNRLITVACALLLAHGNTARAQVNEGPHERRDQAVRGIFHHLSTANEPSKFFTAPTARVLRSMEISFSGGSSFGMGEGTSLLGKVAIGLGGVAEVQLSTSGVFNELTGEETALPSSVLKVALIPDVLSKRWYVPRMAVQMKTTSWGNIVDSGESLAAPVRHSEDNLGNILSSLGFESRFSTLHLIIGKDLPYISLHGGFELTDVRTRRGSRYVWDAVRMDYLWLDLPDKQKEYWSPFGGGLLRINESTNMMAEVQALPQYDYDVETGDIQIRRAWLGIGGIRFFVAPWLTLDTGVRYQSNYAGIADAEINVGVNLVLPIKSQGRR